MTTTTEQHGADAGSPFPVISDDASAGDTAQSSVQSLEHQSFGDYGIREEIVAALADHGITHPFPIQAMTLPVALSRHDIIGQAKTGTGKTLGFGIPMLNRVVSPRDEAFASMPAAGKPQALAVAPTRELALQVGRAADDAGEIGIEVDMAPQVGAVKAGVARLAVRETDRARLPGGSQ